MSMETMKAKQLMLGNYVLYNGLAVRVRNIHDNVFLDGGDESVEVVYDDGVVVLVDPCSLEPIPLTPEILEKNGFDGVYSSNYKIFKEEGYSTLYISLWKGRLSIYKTPDIRQRHAATRLSMDCKYVHELQNALSLCGIEYEVKL